MKKFKCNDGKGRKLPVILVVFDARILESYAEVRDAFF